MTKTDRLDVEPRLSAYRDTLILASIFTLLTAQRYTGIFLVLLVPIFCIWIPYSLVLIWRSPNRRRLQINKILFWVILVSLLTALHGYYYFSTREYANEIIIKILAFKNSHNQYPLSLTELGISNDQVKANLGSGGYLKKENSMPFFIYHSTFIPFDTYYFNFEKNQWDFHAD